MDIKIMKIIGEFCILFSHLTFGKNIKQKDQEIVISSLSSYSQTIDDFNLFSCKLLQCSTIFIRRKCWTLINALAKKKKKT